MDINDIKALVRSVLQNRSEPLWFPGLAEPISRVVWNQLERDIGITPTSYGTSRLLRGNSREVRSIVTRCSLGLSSGVHGCTGGIPIEMLPADIARQFVGDDVQFLEAHKVVGTVAAQLEEALYLLNLVPTVWPTVCMLVRSLHIIDAGGDETDVSFSDPTVPFSVFVSVPRVWSEEAALRVAEAILHEAMHLHLTLVDRVIPLVVPQQLTYYSPWRDKERDSEGMLQALYVFGVIRSFLRLIPERRISTVNDYVVDRIAQINWQIEQAQDFRGCEELTPEGGALVARLLDIDD